MGVIALFGSDQFRTLPWLLYQTSGRYQSGAAAAIALVLLLVSLGFFAGIERVVGGRHAQR
jgi:thiamine transport system permease protein